MILFIPTREVIDWPELWDDMMASLPSEDEREIKAECNPMTTLSEKQKGTFFLFGCIGHTKREEGREKKEENK